MKSADPDSADQDVPVLSRPNQAAPAFPLFRAASNHARNSIERIGEAMTEAAEAVRLLFGEPAEEMLDRVRAAADQAAETRVRANQAAADALRLKHEGEVSDDGRARGSENSDLSFRVVRTMFNLPGADDVVFRAENQRTGEVCRAAVSY